MHNHPPHPGHELNYWCQLKTSVNNINNNRLLSIFVTIGLSYYMDNQYIKTLIHLRMWQGLWNIHLESKTGLSIVKRIKSANILNKDSKPIMFSCFPFKRSNNFDNLYSKSSTKTIIKHQRKSQKNYFTNYDSHGCGLSQWFPNCAPYVLVNPVK